MKNFLYIFIALIIATDGILQGLKIMGIDISRIMQVIAFLFLIKSFYIDIQTNKILNEIIKFTAILFLFLALKMFTTTFILNDLSFSIVNDTLRLALMLVFIYLVYYLLKKDFRYLNLILLFNLPIMLVAFFQFQLFSFSDIAWNIKFDYFNYQYIPFDSIGPIEENVTFRKRVIGLYMSSIPLAYILSTNMIIGIYLYIKSNKNIYLVYFFFLGIITLFTLTRSVVLSFIVLIIYLIYYSYFNSSFLKKTLATIAIIGLLFGSLQLMNETGKTLDRLSSVSGESATGRLPLAITGAVALVEYPFGISKEKYLIIKQEMYKILHHKNILLFPSHNGLLNIGFTYTTFGLIYFIFFVFKLRKIISQHIPKKIKIFFTFAILSYLANGLFHNNFILVKDFYILIFIAIIAYEYDINNKKALKNEN